MPIIHVHSSYLYVETSEKLAPIIEALCTGISIISKGWGEDEKFFLDPTPTRFTVTDLPTSQLPLLTEAEWKQLQQTKNTHPDEAGSSLAVDQTVL